jgi:hypothetical protein
MNQVKRLVQFMKKVMKNLELLSLNLFPATTVATTVDDDEYINYGEAFVEETEAPESEYYYDRAVTGAQREPAFAKNKGVIPQEKLH